MQQTALRAPLLMLSVSQPTRNSSSHCKQRGLLRTSGTYWSRGGPM